MILHFCKVISVFFCGWIVYTSVSFFAGGYYKLAKRQTLGIYYKLSVALRSVLSK